MPYDETNFDVGLQDGIDYDAIAEQDIDEYLSQIIDNLTEYEKELFQDFYLNHRKQKDLAFERGITENLIQQQVFRLKRKVIKIIEKLFD